MKTKILHGERSKLVNIGANCIALCEVHWKYCIIIRFPHLLLWFYGADIQCVDFEL